MVKTVDLLLVAVLVELVAVDYVVPDAVVAAGEGCDGVEEGVAEPDGKHGVFLSAGLTAANAFAFALAHAFTEGKLREACCQRHYRHACLTP